MKRTAICLIASALLTAALGSQSPLFPFPPPQSVYQSPTLSTFVTVHCDAFGCGVLCTDPLTGFCSSTNGGASFSPVIPLGGPATSATLVRDFNYVVVATAEGSATSSDLMTYVSTDFGSTFTGPFALPVRSPNNAATGPHVIVNTRTGLFNLVWSENTATDPTHDVMHSASIDGINWSAPANLSNSPGVDDQFARIVASSSRRLHVAYQEQNAGLSLLACLTAERENRPWSRLPDIAPIRGTTSFDGVALASTSRFGSVVLHAVWNDLDAITGHPDVFTGRSLDGGLAWSIQNVTNSPTPERRVSGGAYGDIVTIGYESALPIGPGIASLLRTSGDGGDTFGNSQRVSIPGSVAGSAIAYDGGSAAVVAVANGNVWAVVTNRPLTRFGQVEQGGCGQPNTPFWTVQGNLGVAPIAVLHTGVANAPAYLGLATSLVPVPLLIENCEVNLDLASLTGVFGFTDPSGRLNVSVLKPLPNRFTGFLQAGVLGTPLFTSTVLGIESAY